MNHKILYKDRDRPLDEGFCTGISLHSHTLHSKESVNFIKRLTQQSLFVRGLIYVHHRTRSDSPTLEGELARLWWRPPLSAGQALHLERSQIEEKLQMAPIVSITDHDNIDAPMNLQLMARNEHVPLSLEWTSPFGATYFHIGVHNLPPKSAQKIFERLLSYREEPRLALLDELMHELAAMPGVLIVFNHPMWDQTGQGAKPHAKCVHDFIRRYREPIHALEINGMRSVAENQRVTKLAEEFQLPLISGGDRHGREPNAMLNVTNASTFAEFADEIVRDGYSRIVIMPQYREPHLLRVIQTLGDVLDEYPDHSLGWVLWSERFFRKQMDGSVKNFTQLFESRSKPIALRYLLKGIRIIANKKLRPAFRLAFAKSPEEVQIDRAHTAR